MHDPQPLGIRPAPQPPAKEGLININGVSRRPLQLWSTRLAAIQALHRVIDVLDIKPFALGRKVGTRNQSMVYQWLSGSSRPSAFYLTAMLNLVLDELEIERAKEKSQP